MAAWLTRRNKAVSSLDASVKCGLQQAAAANYATHLCNLWRNSAKPACADITAALDPHSTCATGRPRCRQSCIGLG